MDPMTVMVYTMLEFPLGSTFEFPLNAAATLPITRDIDGKIPPAHTADSVPKINKSRSDVSMNVKNLTKLICLASG